MGLEMSSSREPPLFREIFNDVFQLNEKPLDGRGEMLDGVDVQRGIQSAKSQALNAEPIILW